MEGIKVFGFGGAFFVVFFYFLNFFIFLNFFFNVFWFCFLFSLRINVKSGIDTPRRALGCSKCY